MGQHRDATPVIELQHCVSDSALKLRSGPIHLEGAVNPHIDRIISQQINFGMYLPEKEWSEIAEAYHLLYAKHQGGRFDWLSQTLHELNDPESVIVMLFCDAYYPFFKNWLASCDHHNIEVRKRVICFTLDQDAQTKALAQGVKTYCLDPELYGGQAGHAGSFSDKRFGRTMFYKNAIVRDLLEMGIDVLFQDVDLIWLRDPFEYFCQNEDVDMQFMFDGPNCIHQPLYANSGFFFARANDATRALLDTALGNTASIFRSGSHQKPLNRILGHFVLHNVLALKILPENLFLNGHLFNLKSGLNPQATQWRESGYVVHYSWSVNREEKGMKMRQFGFSFGS